MCTPSGSTAADARGGAAASQTHYVDLTGLQPGTSYFFDVQTGGVVDANQGQHYQVNNAYCEPRPNPMPPIMVGGAGEQYLLRVVAEHADWWNYVYSSLEEYRQKQVVLKRHCQAVERDYDTIVQVIHTGVLVTENEREVQRLHESPDVRPLENCVIGTPEQVAKTLRAIVRQGASRL